MTTDSKSSATLKNILDDLLSNNANEEINIILSQQDNVEETVRNTLAQKYVEEIKLHFDDQIASMKFYMEKSLNELKKNFKREYANMTSTKDTVDILEFYRNENNQLREQVKDLHKILNGIVKVLQNFHQNEQNQSSMTPPNFSVNIDKNIATKNSSEKSHHITTIDFSIDKTFSTSNCLHLEIPLNFPINNDFIK